MVPGGSVILSDNGIRDAMRLGDLSIEPYNEGQMQPASYDVHLGSKFRWGIPGDEPIDPYDQASIETAFTRERVYTERFLLRPDDVLLGVTKERVRLSALSDAVVDGKSGMGRLFVSIHQTAGFIDPGFYGQVTLEITSALHRPIWLYPGMRIAQLRISRLDSPTTFLYSGGYSDAISDDGPQLSRYWKNERPS